MSKINMAMTLLVVSGCCACSFHQSKTETKLIYFGFDDHSEVTHPVVKIRLADTWAHGVCNHWQATLNEQEADYKILFGASSVTILGRKGQLLYTGGQSVLYAPRGNPDGSGVNICKLTGE
ncbi:MAG TPA: hypothetical protein VIX17_07135 [Pyrinomonadaceae bacterium]|jgi:hypothetical protein